MLTTADGHNQPRFKVFQLISFELYFVSCLQLDLSGMGNPIRIESPASTALPVIEAHRHFHLVTVIVHAKATL